MAIESSLQLEKKETQNLSNLEQKNLDSINDFLKSKSYEKGKGIKKDLDNNSLVKETDTDKASKKAIQNQYDIIKAKVQVSLFSEASVSRLKDVNAVNKQLEDLKIPADVAYKAYEIACALPITNEEAKYLTTMKTQKKFTYKDSNNTYSVDDLSGLEKFLGKGGQITKDILPDINSLKNEMIKLRKATMLSVYGQKKFPGSMPIPHILATGDGSGTKGINGESNVGRWAFEYGNQISETNNKVIFGIGKDKPMTMSIKAFGENKIMQEHGGTMALTFKKGEQEYVINGTYENGKLTLTNSPIPGVVIKGTQITIPDTYKDWDISINTKSNGTTTKDEKGNSISNYDEISFAAIVDNGRIGSDSTGEQYAKGSANVKNDLGEYGVDNNEVQNLTKEVVNQASRTANNINMDIKVQADDTVHDAANIQKYTNGYTTLLKSLSSQKLKDVVTDFKQKIDAMPSVFSGVIADKDGKEITDKTQIDIQNNAQKLLIVNRFITTLIAASKDNPEFVTKVERGAIKINPSFEATTKGGAKGAKITIPNYITNINSTPVKK